MDEVELEARIEALGPERSDKPADALALCDAAYALDRGFANVFGHPVPPLGRHLHKRALALVRAWLPRLDGDVLQQLAWRVDDRRMDVDVATRQAEVAAARAAGNATIVAAEVAALAAAMPPALAAEIEADPANDEVYRVLGDALARAGEPRGELIALQLAQDGPDASAETDRDAEACMAEHRDRFLGPLAEIFEGEAWLSAATWRAGFIRTAKLGIHDPADYASKGRVADATALLLQHPSGRFLVELAIGLTGYANHRDDLAAVAAAIGAHGHGALRTLVLGDFEFPDDSDISDYWVGDVAPIWKLPRLERLELQGRDIYFGGGVDAPALRHLAIRTGGLPGETARAIALMRAPRLEQLTVWFGSGAYGASANADDALAILARGHVPALRTLGLCNAEFTDEIVARLAEAPLLPQLAHLDLSMGTLSDRGADALLRAHPALAHLGTLDLRRSCLTDAACAELEAVFGDRVRLEEQRDPEDARYVTVSE